MVTPRVASWSLIQVTNNWLDAQSRVWFWITGGQGAKKGRGSVLLTEYKEKIYIYLYRYIHRYTNLLHPLK